MKLNRYKVTNYRSVQDSGWIDCNDVTTLVGINEAGKSNLLLALWKLNPARAGIIDILHDMPVSKLSELRKTPSEVKFISAEFIIDAESAIAISNAAAADCKESTKIVVSRFYDGHYEVEYPERMPFAVIEEREPEEEIPSFDQSQFESTLQNAIINEIPRFVYYSNYGNLSSKIYLPNVIRWLNGEQVPGIDANEDQVRTLRVLFEFVNLDAKEVLALGRDPKVVAMERSRNQMASPTKEEIAKAEDDKEQRSILLQSASGRLTKEFKNWWKQGEYKFRFEADGDYFRIWVSDEKRADEVGLELRSTGLQWFLSFYLIFLVESQGSHKNAVLLLDEAGLTLHPLAQKDLAEFFKGLSSTNQIINTTHSPFIVDTNNIDNCRVVYVDKDGYTVASSNLRQGADALNEKSIYAVHAAMGLSVSDVLLQGCQSVIVEGPSDQYYFNAIKAFLIKEKIISPKQEIVFIPSGGVKGVAGVVSIISSKSEKLPHVIVDSDRSGKDCLKKLQTGLYKDNTECIIEVSSIVALENCEVEDIIPIKLLSRGINKLFTGVDEVCFEDEYLNTLPFVPQIEAFAKKYSVELPLGWKVELSKFFKTAMKNKTSTDIDNRYLKMWEKAFEKIAQ